MKGQSMENYDRFPGSESPNRRQFLVTAGGTMAAGVVAAYAPAQAAATADTATAEATATAGEGAVPGKLRINGKNHSLQNEPRTPLRDCLPETVGRAGAR